MIKENKRPLFHPTFGSRPMQIVGRDNVIQNFITGLDEPIGSKDRCTFFVGQRGMGKTALLQELADEAEEHNYIVAGVTCYDGMNDEIVEVIQSKGAKIVGDGKKKVKGVQAGALGFSFGLTFSDEAEKQYGFRTKLTMLVDKLAEFGKRVLILVDEAKTSEEMRQLAVTYQQLVGEDKDIAIGMAGLPQSISSVLNDDVLTFLNRANKVEVGPISINSIKDYYSAAFSEAGVAITDDEILQVAEATYGFPYLMQLIGYYILKYSKEGRVDNEVLEKAIRSSGQDLDENVFAPIIKPLSDKDLMFLKAMAEDDGESRTIDICKRMGKPNSYIQPYRLRLIEAGIIDSPRKGALEFTVPYIRGYLRTLC